MSIQTVVIDFHGILFTVSGRYYEAEPEVNIGPHFEIAAIKAGIIHAGDYRLEELADRDIGEEALDFLEDAAIGIIEDGFEAAACEAEDARAEARRDAQRYD